MERLLQIRREVEYTTFFGASGKIVAHGILELVKELSRVPYIAVDTGIDEQSPHIMTGRSMLHLLKKLPPLSVVKIKTQSVAIIRRLRISYSINRIEIFITLCTAFPLEQTPELKVLALVWIGRVEATDGICLVLPLFPDACLCIPTVTNREILVT